MSLWRHLTHGLRRLINPTAAEQAVADDLQDYVNRATDDYIARGWSPDDARRAARLDAGSLTGAAQQVREYGWEHAVDTFLADVRYAARRLRKSPGFTAIAVVTLALGVGATTAIFSALKPILVDPLPYPDANRIVMVWEMRHDGVRVDSTFGMYRGLTERTRSFDALALFKPWQPTLSGFDQPERLEGQRVSDSFFRVLGISPIVGRQFDASDDRVGGGAVVILSHRLWQRRFSGDQTIVGRHVMIDGISTEVIGVMPSSFENALEPSAELWAPLQYGMSQGRAWGHHLQTVGRLREDANRDYAARELESIGLDVIAEHRPLTYRNDVSFSVIPLQEDVTRDVRPALLISLAAVVVVLTIACVNVTNLLIGRAAERRAEFALRSALGAGRARMIRQVLTESLLLAALGGILGIGVALGGLRAIVALSASSLPRAGAIGLDTSGLGFVLGVTTIVGLAIGLMPALQAGSNAPTSRLEEAVRTTSRRRSTRRLLVVAEVSLAVVLLVSSGLLLRSLHQLLSVRVGVEPSGLLTLQVQTSGPRFREPAATLQFFTQALSSVRNVPGVSEAALTSQLPLSGDVDVYGVHFDPPPAQDPGEVSGSLRYSVSPGYVEAMRIPIVRGRTFAESDRDGAPLVALISESLAKRRLPGLDPLGKQLRIGPPTGPLYTVVGVVGDVKQRSLSTDDAEAVYTTEAQWRFGDPAMSMVIRAHGDVTSLVPAIRQAIWSVDKAQPIVRIAMFDDLVTRTAALRRFVLVLIEAFAVAALALAAAGVYGVLTTGVTERTREIGIRAALGASRRSILFLVLREGLLLTGLGTAIGATAAIAASEALATMLFGISQIDPLTYLAVIALMLATTAAACWMPSWRAVRLDPARTLRSE